jgi:hypothetical protein
MKIKQISIYSENKPGQLSAICRALAQADVNITTLSLADTSDFGIVRLIVDDHEKARSVLSENGHLVNVKDVLAVCVPDRPRGMAEVMHVLDEAGANIEYGYAFSFHKGEKAVLVFRLSDGDVAEKALSAAGVAMLNEEEIAEASK